VAKINIHDLFVYQEAGTEIEPMGDLNTEAEKKLGRLVKEKYVESTSLVSLYSFSCFSNTIFYYL
jgi:aspartyl-tRNA synthetase